MIKNCEIVIKSLTFMFYLSIYKIPSVTLKHILKKQLVKQVIFNASSYTKVQIIVVS